MRARTQRLLAGGLVAVLALVLLLEPQRGASLGQAASPVAASTDGRTSRRTFQSLAAADAGTESSASPATGQPSGVHHNLENVAELVDNDAGTDVSSTVMDTQGNMTLAVNDTSIMTTSTSVETVAPTTGSTTAPVITDQSSSAAPVQPTTETGASPTTSTNTAAPSSASPTTEGPLMTWPTNTTSPLTSTAATTAPPLSTTPVELPTNVTLPSFPPVTMPNATENVTSTTVAPLPNLTLTTSTPNVTFPLTQSPTTAAVPPLPSPTPVELRVHVFCSASNNHVDSWAFESDGSTMDPGSTFDFVVDSTEPNVDIDAHVADLCDAWRASSAPIPTRLVDIVCSPRASGDDTWFFSDPAVRPLVSLVGVVVSDTVISSDTMMAAFVAKECDMWRSDLLNSTTTVAPVPVNTTQPPMFVPANLTIVCPQRTATPCSVANVSGCWSNASAAAANQPPDPWWAELPWWAHYVAWDGRSGSLTLEVNASRWNTTEALDELEAVVCRKAVNTSQAPGTTVFTGTDSMAPTGTSTATTDPPPTATVFNRSEILHLFYEGGVLARTPIFTVGTFMTNVTEITGSEFSLELARRLRQADTRFELFDPEEATAVFQFTACAVLRTSKFSSEAIHPQMCRSSNPCTGEEPRRCEPFVRECTCPQPETWLPLRDDFTNNDDGSSDSTQGDEQRRRQAEEPLFVQIQFPIRLDVAHSYNPDSSEAIIDVLNASTQATLDMLTNASSPIVERFNLNPDFVILRYAYDALGPTTVPLLPSQPGPGPQLLWLLVLLVIPVGALAFGVFRLVQYIRWRRYGSSLRCHLDQYAAEDEADDDENRPFASPSVATNGGADPSMLAVAAAMGKGDWAQGERGLDDDLDACVVSPDDALEEFDLMTDAGTTSVEQDEELGSAAVDMHEA